MRLFARFQIYIFQLWPVFRPGEFRAQHAAGPQGRREIIPQIFFFVACTTNSCQFNMITINSRPRPKKSLVHLDPSAHLHRAHGISRHGLVHVAKPRQARRRAARAALRHTVRLQRPRGLENRFVYFTHRVYRIQRRLVVVLRVIAWGRCVNVVQLVPVESPITNEALRQPFVISLHFRYRRTKCRQIARHPRRFPVFIKCQPVRMLSDYF